MFVFKCRIFQHVIAKYLKPGCFTQIIDVPTWKLEAINMYFCWVTDIPWFHSIFNAFSLNLVCVQKPFY